jgi:hypothetical protein
MSSCSGFFRGTDFHSSMIVAPPQVAKFSRVFKRAMTDHPPNCENIWPFIPGCRGEARVSLPQNCHSLVDSPSLTGICSLSRSALASRLPRLTSNSPPKSAISDGPCAPPWLSNPLMPPFLIAEFLECESSKALAAEFRAPRSTIVPVLLRTDPSVRLAVAAGFAVCDQLAIVQSGVRFKE